MPTKFVTNPRRAPALRNPRLPLGATKYSSAYVSASPTDYPGQKVADIYRSRKGGLFIVFTVGDGTGLIVDVENNVKDEVEEYVAEMGMLKARGKGYLPSLEFIDAPGAKAPTKRKNPRRPAAKRNPSRPRPSEGTLTSGLDISPQQAAGLRRFMYLRSPEQILQAANAAMQGHGVDYTPSEQDTPSEKKGLGSVLMSDWFSTTLVYDYDKQKYVVAAWGDVVKANRSRFGTVAREVASGGPRTNPAPKYICTNDRYCPTPDTFSSLSDFQAMCEAVFGMRVPLASVGGDTYVDERGEVVLRPARRPAARRKNPASSRPSVKMLSQVVTPAEAKELRNMMGYTGPTGVLRAASRMMDGFDVIYLNSRNDTMRTPDGLEFVNMGDTYNLTLVYDHNKGKYVVTTWGDIVEADARLPKSRQRFQE